MVYILEMISDNENSELSWKSHKAVRADLLTNRDFSRVLIKIGFIFFVLFYCSRLLPNAHEITSYIPEKWNRTDVLQVHDISALSRYIKIYAMPANKSEDMDLIHQVDVYSLKDSQQHQKKLEVRIADMDDFIDISGGELKFFFGELRILDQVAYSINIQKPLKVERRVLQSEGSNHSMEALPAQQTNSSQLNKNQNVSMLSNDTKPEESQEQKQRKEQQQKKKKQQEEEKKKKEEEEEKKKKEDEEKKRKEEEEEKKKKQEEEENKKKEEEEEKKKKEDEENKKKQEEEEKKRKEEEEEKKKKQEEAKRKQQQQKRVKQEEERLKQEEEKKRKEEQAERQKIHDYTNIQIQVQQMSSFGTVMELFVRYISMLVIIYVAADNTHAPKSLPIICGIISNPLLFLQISYPNRVSDVIDCVCQSGPLLYIPAWLFYIHTNITFPDETKHKVYLGIKTGLGILLYILNVLRLLGFPVFFTQVIITLPLGFFLGSYLWQAFLDLHHQHHRDKVLIMTTLCYISALLAFKSIFFEWKYLISYILHQFYGLYIIYLLGLPGKGKKKKRNEEKEKQRSVVKQVKIEEIKSAHYSLK